MALFDWHAERSAYTPLDIEAPATGASPIDLVAVRRYRLGRVREQMRRLGIGALILSDPVNIRYATGARNMQVFSARNAPARYCLVTERRVILFEFTGCEHLARGLETIDEIRPAHTASFVAAGPLIAERERSWAREMAALIVAEVGPGVPVGMERMNAGSALALAAEGFPLVDAQQPLELARCIKSAEEVKCAEASLRATEAGVAALREAIHPGITENALWSVLHQAIIERDGDYCETRLLSSGERTNPWFQETGNKPLEANELVALDTDVVGCHGYYSDFSRTFHVGPARPSAEQRELYRLAHEQVHHNMAIIAPGLSFREYAERAWDIPPRFHANRYYLSAHGVGMTGEYPYLYHRADFPDAGYDGVIQPGMTLCVESYIGAEDGREGVKLEEQLLVTETGTRLLSRFPFEEALMSP
ncbi:Xaa-Pro peptidase family protein [Halomonas sp. CKK8]|uniref:M24 family metallopeptidase n=1 Tax=Halomonas sp. CKK8 TaxID=3036127 RepID=UPI002415108E|nr:Xaa-Pro peptidase family protein [Halomonas sp. CKK8]WFM71140.1 Xaa-Pro peptidase family protein [Halomonas sp. CKK8]